MSPWPDGIAALSMVVGKCACEISGIDKKENYSYKIVSMKKLIIF
jgi:hypothetical protein